MNTSKIDFRKPQNMLAVAIAAFALFLFAQSGSRAPRTDVHNVSVEEASAMINAGAVVVDVRPKDAYDARHIPGAVNVPLSTLENGIPASLNASITKPMVVYCGDGTTIGPDGTAGLNKAGFSKAVNLEKGIQGWASAGLPVKKP